MMMTMMMFSQALRIQSLRRRSQTMTDCLPALLHRLNRILPVLALQDRLQGRLLKLLHLLFLPRRLRHLKRPSHRVLALSKSPLLCTKPKSDQSAVLLKTSGLLSTREARGRLWPLLLLTGCMQEVDIVTFRSLGTI